MQIFNGGKDWVIAISTIFFPIFQWGATNDEISFWKTSKASIRLVKKSTPIYKEFYYHDNNMFEVVFDFKLIHNNTKNTNMVVIGAPGFMSNFCPGTKYKCQIGVELPRSYGTMDSYPWDNDWHEHIVVAGPNDIKNYNTDTVCNTSVLTNTCVKCGYHNEYIDPVVNYTCKQCSLRASAWS